MLRTLVLSLAVLSAVPAVAQDGMARQEIVDELVGRDIAWWDAAGWRHGYLMFLPDGKAEMTIDDAEKQRTRGSWVLRGDQVCTRWDKAREGSEKCYRVQRGDKGMFVTTGGNVFEVRELGV